MDGSGNVWVVDAGTGHVAKFNSSGAFLSELGVPWTHGTDNSHFMYPVSIAFDAAGNIYVSDGAPWTSYVLGTVANPIAPGNQRIQVFDSSGAWIKTIGVTGVSGSDNTHFNGPRHIAINGNLLYVADTGNNRVQILNISNPSSPTYVGTIAPAGANQFNNPSGVAVDSNYIYVADTENSLVKVFNKSAPYAFVAQVGDTGGGAYELDHPYRCCSRCVCSRVCRGLRQHTRPAIHLLRPYIHLCRHLRHEDHPGWPISHGWPHLQQARRRRRGIRRQRSPDARTAASV